jgi:hypothetical protein
MMRMWWDSAGSVMWQWCNSDAFDLSTFMSFSSFWDVIDHILSFCNALGMCLVTQDLLTKAVMEQWCNSDQTVMPSIWAFHSYWSCFILLQCLVIVFGDTRPFDKNSDETVMRQWWNSDATVMEQWCNSDQTVMPSIWAFHSYFQGFEMSLIIFYHFSMPWDCFWWHKSFWQKQCSNSMGTVMEQWWNSDAFDLSSFMSFSSFWDVIDDILSFCNAFEVWLCIL